MRQLELTPLDPDYVVVWKEYEFVRDSIAILQTKMSHLYSKAQELCPHETTQINEHYYSGDYFNMGYTEYTKVCSYCGKELGSRKVCNGSYG